jgi:cystathionine beta-lyase/cystathionine gamma-synthase
LVAAPPSRPLVLRPLAPLGACHDGATLAVSFTGAAARHFRAVCNAMSCLANSRHPADLLWLSVGIEDPGDLIADLYQALTG